MSMILSKMKLIFPTLLGLFLMGCEAMEPIQVMPEAAIQEDSEPQKVAGETEAKEADLSEEKWVEQALLNLDSDPQSRFEMATLEDEASREFSIWAAESLLAAEVRLPEGEMAEAAHLQLWFSEEFSTQVLGLNRSEAVGLNIVETEGDEIVAAEAEGAYLSGVRCQQSRNLCLMVIQIQGEEQGQVATLIFLTTIEPVDGKMSVFLYAEKDGQYERQAVGDLASYLEYERAQMMLNAFQRCSLDPLQDETVCTNVLQVDEEGLEQLVILLCTRGTAEGETLAQCQTRFVQYCSDIEAARFPEVQAQVCEEMSQAGYSLEEESDDTLSEEDENLQEEDEGLEQDDSSIESDEGLEFEEAL